MKPEKIKIRLEGSKEICPGIKSFFFSTEEKFNYRAGQYVFIGFNYGGREFSKPFTVSNAPSRKNIEISTIISGSEFKTALDSLKKNSLLYLRGPYGRFTLEQLKEDYVSFLAGGIGITPVKSILEMRLDEKRPLRGSLFYSNRSVERIAFKDELKKIEDKFSGFKVVHTITSEDSGSVKNWKGERGYISEDMIKKHFPYFKESRFYIVGPPAFNGAMKKMLKDNLKISSGRISLENFAGY